MRTALSSITIPQSVTRMMIDVFRYCDDLQYIELLPTTPPTIYNNTFNGIPSTCIFYVPSESVETYKAAQYWSTYANRIQAIP